MIEEYCFTTQDINKLREYKAKAIIRILNKISDPILINLVEWLINTTNAIDNLNNETIELYKKGILKPEPDLKKELNNGKTKENNTQK